MPVRAVSWNPSFISLISRDLYMFTLSFYNINNVWLSGYYNRRNITNSWQNIIVIIIICAECPQLCCCMYRRWKPWEDTIIYVAACIFKPWAEYADLRFARIFKPYPDWVGYLCACLKVKGLGRNSNLCFKINVRAVCWIRRTTFCTYVQALTE